MTPNEPHPASFARERLACALFAFVTVLVIGAGAGWLMIDGFRAKVEETARRDAKIIGESVARSLAGQFEKAARFGIPLKLLPGVEPYLAETMARTPGLTRIVVRGPDGREVRSAVGPVVGVDTVIAPILVDGIQLGQVDVTTTPSTLSALPSSLGLRTALVVPICAVLAAVLAAYYVGGSLGRSRKRLVNAMVAAAAGQPVPPLPVSTLNTGAVGVALSAVGVGERRLADQRAAFQAYAEELLAVDFDGRLRPDIERARREALARGVSAPSADRGL